MNSRKFRAKMIEHGDTADTLAGFLHLARNTLYRKIRGENADFDQREILALKSRWNLSADDVDNIFFTDEVS